MQDTMAPATDMIPVPGSAVDGTHCTLDQYRAMYARSMDDPDGFWLEQAGRLDWFKKPTSVSGWSFDPVEIAWFEDGEINICHNAVDRHVEAGNCLLYTSPSPRDATLSRMPSSA